MGKLLRRRSAARVALAATAALLDAEAYRLTSPSTRLRAPRRWQSSM
jgi:hypothetical protein